MTSVREQTAILREELRAYSKQAPVLYLIAIGNATTLAFSHYGIAPTFLAVVAPALIVSMCGFRMVHWLRNQGKSLGNAELVSTSRRTTVIAGIVGVVFLVWLTALWIYGTPETRAHVNLVAGITGVAAVVGMSHVRTAAITMCMGITLPFALFLLTQGKTSALVAINLLLVLCGVLYVLVVTSSDFKKMVLAQIETKRLGDENLRLANLDSLTELPNRRSFFRSSGNNSNVPPLQVNRKRCSQATALSSRFAA